MATISELLALAIQHHQAGRLHEAEQLYRQIVATEFSNARAWHLLGAIAWQTGKHEVAMLCSGKAIELNPHYAEAYYNLGLALQSLGRFQEAAASYQQAVTFEPQFVEAYTNLGIILKLQGDLAESVSCLRLAVQLKPTAESISNLGSALREQGELDEAIICCRRAIELKPDYVEAHNNLGLMLQDQGKTDEAVACYHRALELRLDIAEIHNNLGDALNHQGEFDQAIVCCRRALELNPDLPQAHNNLGIALKGQGKLDEAVAAYRRALELKPDYAESHNNLGIVLNDQGNVNEAIACFKRALKWKPDYAGAHNNLASVLWQLRRFDEAFASFDRALQCKSDYFDTQYNRSMMMLLLGDFERGWQEYEWRWKNDQFVERVFPQPRWDGNPLDRRAILLHAEQGLGDTIQFVRYAEVIKSQNPAATALVRCQRPLAKLLASCPHIDRLIAEGDELPAFDVHAPLLSLPRILHTTLDAVPGKVPYLFAENDVFAEWRDKLEKLRGFRIGINWQGRSGHGEFRKRNIPLEHFAALARIPNIHLIALQRGEGSEELLKTPEGPPIFNPGPDFDTVHGPFMDTAAVMMNVDLVISSDTSVPHLAGALGVPVWLALPYMCNWHWLLDRPDSPWYPTMRLFRQKSQGNWAPVFEELASALRALITNR